MSKLHIKKGDMVCVLAGDDKGKTGKVTKVLVEKKRAIVEGVNDNYMSSVWKDVIELISKISNKEYVGNEKSMRIIADHIRTGRYNRARGSNPYLKS